MADGTTKPISKIEPGDMVLAQDPETGEIGARKVTDAWVHDDDLVRLEIDGDIVRTTEDHPFWNDTDKQWQRADQLDSGDLVLTADGRRVKVGVLIGSAGRGSAYNFTVEGLHTYHVLFGTDAVLVHNACPLVEFADDLANLDASKLKMTNTVQQHASRAYNNSSLTLQEILDAGVPRVDPQGAANALRWDVPGSLDGRAGTWEVVIDMKTKTILHYLFKGTR